MDVTFLSRTNVRDAPTIQGHILEVAEASSQAQILSQQLPVKIDGYEWWYLQYTTGTIGWSTRKYKETILFTVEEEAFNNAILFTLGWEGGLSENLLDPGGLTKFGISQRSYPFLDIRNLTVEQAVQIYYEDYWLRSRAYLYTYPKHLILLDTAALFGVSRALVLRELETNVILYKQLYAVTNSLNFAVFGKGWIRRLADLVRLS